jgi:hypothetical protein
MNDERGTDEWWQVCIGSIAKKAPECMSYLGKAELDFQYVKKAGKKKRTP